MSQFKEYQKADIIHLHSIQGGFFDRTCLPLIAHEKKVLMTLHDDWIISGNDENNNLFPYKTKKSYLTRKKILEQIPIAYVGVSQWMSDKVRNDKIT